MFCRWPIGLRHLLPMDQWSLQRRVGDPLWKFQGMQRRRTNNDQIPHEGNGRRRICWHWSSWAQVRKTRSTWSGWNLGTKNDKHQLQAEILVVWNWIRYSQWYVVAHFILDEDFFVVKPESVVPIFHYTPGFSSAKFSTIAGGFTAEATRSKKAYFTKTILKPINPILQMFYQYFLLGVYIGQSNKYPRCWAQAEHWLAIGV